MRANGPGLAHPQDVDPGRPERGQQQHRRRHHHLAGQRGHAEPDRHRPVDDDGDHRGDHQDPVGHRVEHLPDRGDLVVAAGHEPVDPVGGPEHSRAARPPPSGGRSPNRSQRNRGMQASRTRVMALGTVRIRSERPTRVVPEPSRWRSAAMGPPVVESLIELPLVFSPTTFTARVYEQGRGRRTHPARRVHQADGPRSGRRQAGHPASAGRRSGVGPGTGPSGSCPPRRPERGRLVAMGQLRRVDKIIGIVPGGRAAGPVRTRPVPEVGADHRLGGVPDRVGRRRPAGPSVVHPGASAGVHDHRPPRRPPRPGCGRADHHQHRGPGGRAGHGGRRLDHARHPARTCRPTSPACSVDGAGQPAVRDRDRRGPGRPGRRDARHRCWWWSSAPTAR